MAELKIYDVDEARKNRNITLKDGIFDDGFSNMLSMRDVLLLDIGALVTRKGERGGIVIIHSPNKGQVYEILDLLKNAPWNPNQRRATLHIKYQSGEEQYTYLDQRLEDIEAPAEAYDELAQENWRTPVPFFDD